MRRGHTLIELALVLVLMGLLVHLVALRMAALADAGAVRDESMRLVAALDAARGAAQRLGTVAHLTLADTAYLVTATVDTERVIAWRATGPVVRGIVLGGAGAALDFGPAGIAQGVSNRTLVVTKGHASRRVVISRLGRITW